jgi:DNA-binding NarL/FixJ family response regulator
VHAEPGGPALAVNFYRHVEGIPFSDTDRDRLRAAAQLILACVARHVAIGEQLEPRRVGATAGAPPAGASCLAGLPRREREVCERLLRGWTHDGIGADLGIGATTVKTYRDRAFERLGIHQRNELFALVLRGSEDGTF